MFWTIFLIGLAYLAIAIILIFIGLYLTHRWTANRVIHKAETAEPDSINFDRCSEEEFEAKVAELRKVTEGKGS